VSVGCHPLALESALYTPWGNLRCRCWSVPEEGSSRLSRLPLLLLAGACFFFVAACIPTAAAAVVVEARVRGFTFLPAQCKR